MKIASVTRSTALAVGLVLVTSAAPHRAAAADPAPQRAEQHCVVVLDKLQPGATSSRVVSRRCADSPEAAQLSSAADVAPQATTLLLVLYQDLNYGGPSTRIEGSAGPCDTAGYGFSNLGSWRNRISSFKRFNWCQRVQGFDAVNYGGGSLGVWTADTSWVGASANDRIDSILTRRL